MTKRRLWLSVVAFALVLGLLGGFLPESFPSPSVRPLWMKPSLLPEKICTAAQPILPAFSPPAETFLQFAEAHRYHGRASVRAESSLTAILQICQKFFQSFRR